VKYLRPEGWEKREETGHPEKSKNFEHFEGQLGKGPVLSFIAVGLRNNGLKVISTPSKAGKKEKNIKIMTKVREEA